MPLSDSYKNVVQAALAATRTIDETGEQRVMVLGVAALLIRMQAELSGDTTENTIELMRDFLSDWDKAPTTVTS